MEQKKKAAAAAFPHTIPVLTGFLFLGIAYGILMKSKGYGVLWTFLMSAVAFCGSMQFVAITLLTAVFQPLQAFLLSLMVNARHLFYGISMLSKYKGMGRIKPFLIYTLCDETFSIVCSKEPPEGVSPKWFYFFISLFHYLYWVAGSVTGALLGELLRFNTSGLDFALTALFVVIFTEQWLSMPHQHLAAIIGVASSVVCLLLFGPDRFIIPSMAVIMANLFVFRRNCEKYEKQGKKGETGE